ncbi:unnamed protein product [Ectocarpus sp. CCAP 1310/34]|nr:unnamed protein product [Ectocarpus sp. CCAP 1310/34]
MVARQPNQKHEYLLDFRWHDKPC